MALNSDHYAIVVGLADYPVLGDPPPTNLRGPINDADAVEAWLIDPNGGGLPPANVKKITSPRPMPPTGAPVRDDIQLAFVNLADAAETNRIRLGALLGQRLYVYVSGHGFSPMVNQGCLLAGNAGGIAMGNNVWVTRWLEQFQDAGYFFETVLWMDCCMNRDRDQASSPTVQPRVSGSPPGPSFAAFAARRPLRAVEQETKKGEYHGVFTTVLLEGLRGAAANPYGMVTGRSLADWLRNAQRARLSKEDLADPIVSKEPEVLKEDQALVFARALAPTRYDVVLTIPAGSGKEWKLWSGRPVTFETGKIPGSSKLKLKLRPGLYAIEVSDLGLRQGFEVTGPSAITISEKGPPVAVGNKLVPITVDPSDPTAEIYLVDEAFSLVDRDIGKLSTKVPPAIYKTRIRSGDRLAEQVYLLDRSPTAEDAVPELPAFASAVPFSRTAFTHEYHQDGLAHAFDATFKVGTGAHILLMSRVWRKNDNGPVGLPPDALLELWDERNNKIADIITNGHVDNSKDAYATLLVEVDPGNYFIRRRVGSTDLEQLVPALPGWRTSYFFLVTPDEAMPSDVSPMRVALLMHPMGQPFDEPADMLILQAQNAVGKGRAVLTAELEPPLVRNPTSPLAAILGGHLLILEQLKRPTLRIERLKDLVAILRAGFGTIPSGDIDALNLTVSDPDTMLEPIGAPPVLKASWDLITQASLTRRELVPLPLYQRIYAGQPAGAFLAWAADAETRRSSLQQLKEAVAEPVAATVSMPSAAFAPAASPMPAPGVPDIPAEALPPAPAYGPGTGGRMADAGAGDEGLPTLAPGLDMGGEAVAAAAAAPPSMTPEPLPAATADKLKALGLPPSALDL